MNNNNIVDFPAQDTVVQKVLKEEEEKKLPLTEEQMKQAVSKGQTIAIEKMEANKKTGLEKADRALLSLDEKSGIASEPGVEARLRALESAVRGLTSAAEGIGGLTTVIKHDLIKTISGIDAISQDAWRKGAHLQTLIQLLNEKKLISEEDLKEVWDRLVPQLIEAMKNPNPE